MIEIHVRKGSQLRAALALSHMTGKSFMHTGKALQAQHLAGIKTLQKLSESSYHDSLYIPQPLRSGLADIDIGTAGSIALASLPALHALMTRTARIMIRYKGGTDVPFAPTMHAYGIMLHTLQPYIAVNLDIQKHAGYPAGGGRVDISAASAYTSLDDHPPLLVKRTAITKATLHLVAPKASVHTRSLEKEAELFELLGKTAPYPVTATIHYVDGDVSSATLEMHGSIRYGDSTLETRNIADWAHARLKVLAHVGCDAHTADQLLIPLFLFGGAIETEAITEHIAGIIDVIETFMPGSIRVEKTTIISEPHHHLL